MIGTLINVVAILIGTALGTLIGSRIPGRTRTLVTDALGLVSFLAAAGAASCPARASRQMRCGHATVRGCKRTACRRAATAFQNAARGHWPARRTGPAPRYARV